MGEYSVRELRKEAREREKSDFVSALASIHTTLSIQHIHSAAKPPPTERERTFLPTTTAMKLQSFFSHLLAPLSASATPSHYTIY